ncbi:MAG: rod shape-determining protein MreC [Clostridia bacterium]|nr:rod shape-determining protein MreC [Clostridia bacterium]
MNQFFTNRRAIVTAVCVVVLVLLVYSTSRDRARLSVAEQVAREVFAPVAKVATKASRAVSSWVSFVVSVRSMKRENDELRAEVDRLRLSAIYSEEAMLENQRLASLLNLKMMLRGRSEAARVAYRDPGNWLESVVIDKGSANGVVNALAAVNDRGVVGRVVSATSHTATVMLAIDARSAIGGLDLRSRDLVVADGLGDGSGLMTIRPLGVESDLQVGDVIITSGLGGVYPKGYVVGDIISVERGKYGVSMVALARPRVDFQHLEEMLILVDSAEGVAK